MERIPDKVEELHVSQLVTADNQGTEEAFRMTPQVLTHMHKCFPSQKGKEDDIRDMQKWLTYPISHVLSIMLSDQQASESFPLCASMTDQPIDFRVILRVSSDWRGKGKRCMYFVSAALLRNT
jgi:hypothetical protein